MKVVLVILMFIPFSLCSQIDTTDIKVVGKIANDGSLKLRWFTESNIIWQQGLQHGYQLEVAKYNPTKSNDEQEYKKIELITKWSKSKVTKALNSYPSTSIDHKYINVSYDIAKADGTLQPGMSFEEAMEYKKQLDLVYGYAMIASMMCWDAAKVQGLACNIKESSKESIYRISLNTTIEGVYVSPAYIKMEELQSDQSYKRKIEVTESEQSIGLKWEKSKDVFASFVEYSDDGVNFIGDQELPNIQLSTNGKDKDSLTYAVDNLTNSQLYYFKVFGQNIFGERVLIGEVEGTPRDKTAPTRPVILGANHIESDLVEITWSTSILDTDLAGYAVGRGIEPFGQYYQIHEGLIPPERNTFDDIYFDRDTTNYYIVEAVDKAGNRSRSSHAYLTLIDSIPPDRPINITGTMDSFGIVTLEMEPQKERDFMGYRIYKANDPKHEFSVVQETYNDTIVAWARKPTIIDTSTLESLTPFVYYHVTALDYHYNESKFSEVIKVPRPDKYPPVPPLFSEYYVKGDSIIFSIIASTSVDVEQNYLYGRLSGTEDEWVLIDSIGLNDTTYVHTPKNSKMHEYSLKARDNSNLFSDFASVLRVKTISRPKPYPLSAECKYFQTEKKLLVKWEFVSEPVDDYKVVFNRLDKSSLGRTEVNPINIFVIDEYKYIENINLSVVQKSMSYLPVATNRCTIVNSDISNDEDYIKYQKEK